MLRDPDLFVGTARSRVDGPAKVTGQARYAAEFTAPDLAHGVVLSSAIARGRITSIDAVAALAVPGVIQVFTHENRRGTAWLDYKIPRRGGAARIALSAALRCRDPLQRPADRAGRRRGFRDRRLRRVAGSGRVRRRRARDRPRGAAPRGLRFRRRSAPASSRRLHRAATPRRRSRPRPSWWSRIIRTRSSTTTRWSRMPRP